jgi:hypothetical protein
MSDQKVVVQPNPGSSTSINVDVSEVARQDGSVVERQRVNISDSQWAGSQSGNATVEDNELSVDDSHTRDILTEILIEIRFLTKFIMNSLR